MIFPCTKNPRFVPRVRPPETQKVLRIKKTIVVDVVRSDSIIGVLSLFEFKSIDDVGAGKPEMLTLHTNPHDVHGRLTPKNDCERQFWNGPFRELKERINDRFNT